jgi:Rrf2 family protein
MNFSKTASYSLNILSFMAANENESMSAKYLNEQLHIPYPYLRAVLLSLSKKGFISGTRGKNGGFVLSRPGSEITLAEIIESTDGMDSFNKCILGFETCPFNSQCSMHEIWESTRKSITYVLKGTTLSDTVKKRVL